MKRRDFLQLIGLAGAAVALPAPLQALAEGPLDEELSATLSLNGKEIRLAEVRTFQETTEVQSLLGETFSIPSLVRQEILLELDWAPPKVFALEDGPVDLEVNFEGVSFKAKAHVKRCEWRSGKEDICSVELVPVGPVEMVKR